MPETIIVIPCYNEALRLETALFESFLKINTDIGVIFVNDGSTDDTFSILCGMQKKLIDQIEIINFKKNAGKGHAIQNGVLNGLKNGQCRFIGYLDADLATPLDEVIRLLAILKKGGIAGILGSRVNLLGHQIKRSYLRYVFSRILSLIVKLRFKIDVYDTQCGAKFFNKEIAGRIFEKDFKCRWLFDIELLIRLRSVIGVNLQSDLLEEPLKIWSDKKDSKIRMKDYFTILSEFMRISRNY